MNYSIADECLQLLIHHPHEAAILQQTLESDDIWATTLPILEPPILQKSSRILSVGHIDRQSKTLHGTQIKNFENILFLPCKSLWQGYCPQEVKNIQANLSEDSQAVLPTGNTACAYLRSHYAGLFGVPSIS